MKKLSATALSQQLDFDNRIWSPVELSHCFDDVKTRQSEVKSLTVLHKIDTLMDRFTKREIKMAKLLPVSQMLETIMRLSPH